MAHIERFAGLVEPTTPDVECVRCRQPATLYTLDANHNQRFTCIGCHGSVVAALLHAETTDALTETE